MFIIAFESLNQMLEATTYYTKKGFHFTACGETLTIKLTGAY